MPSASTWASPGSACSSEPARIRAAAEASDEYGVTSRWWVSRSTTASIRVSTTPSPSATTPMATNGSSTTIGP